MTDLEKLSQAATHAKKRRICAEFPTDHADAIFEEASLFDMSPAYILRKIVAEWMTCDRSGGLVERVKVKPLEWGHWREFPAIHSWNDLAALAYTKTSYGVYCIGRKRRRVKSTNPDYRPFNYEYSSEWWLEFNSGELRGPYKHDVEAKAAARTHHETIILAALEGENHE